MLALNTNIINFITNGCTVLNLFRISTLGSTVVYRTSLYVLFKTKYQIFNIILFAILNIEKKIVVIIVCMAENLHTCHNHSLAVVITKILSAF